mmetsp:Transcript_56849/g.144116  ORF Transcript_56849/g.144116 Transcript_56849/m.144116 type:complete len:218 (-) Transcript_56849:113-766(-)
MSSSSSGKMMQYDHLVKLLLIGDSGVGKSSLLVRFADDKFTPQMSQTIGMDFKVKMLELGGKRVKLQIWDTAGQERFHTITQQYYRNAMGIILVYDVMDEASFSNIRRWAAQISTHGVEGTDKLLVGSKADCDPQQRKVDATRGQALADEYGIPFLETSARSGQNVKEAFTLLADTVRRRLQSKEAGGLPSPSIGSVQLGIKDSDGGPARERCCGGG